MIYESIGVGRREVDGCVCLFMGVAADGEVLFGVVTEKTPLFFSVLLLVFD
jgi:hypothetical protein